MSCFQELVVVFVISGITDVYLSVCGWMDGWIGRKIMYVLYVR